MTVPRRIMHSGIALLAALTALLSTTLSRAQQCSNETTEGRYLVVCDGYLTPAPNGPLVPAKVLATAVADENGTFKSSDSKISLGGTLLAQTVIGTQELHPDCTGTITYTQTINGEPAPPLDIDFVVSDHGARIDGLAVDTGTVLSCHLTRIATRVARDR